MGCPYPTTRPPPGSVSVPKQLGCSAPPVSPPFPPVYGFASQGALVVARLIWLLGHHHARRPWGDANLPGIAEHRPWGKGMKHRVCAFGFAIGCLGSEAALLAWLYTGNEPAYWMSLTLPWTNGLVIETYICWQIVGFFPPVLSEHLWLRLGLILAAVVTITFQLCGVLVPLKALAFIANAVFRFTVTAAIALYIYKWPTTRTRKFKLIGCLFGFATLADVLLALLFPLHYQSSLIHVYCLTHALLELAILFLLYAIRVWKTENRGSHGFRASTRALGCTSINTELSQPTS
ncbi:hypothetical protein BU26DRAFT_79041 [Trematosphaeria pertusa]|uniref:Uncharacterized protein n=1 Tax=Trematosphaeria pertusa TaxID=390896 RepID=A0A6A6I4E2_9PLEO|nr:uncharacterized protein BU26DRAFT_79041 [Trematosphaeria pertusa]KAF2245231.1 hypothetical protein BU26DRAFT_79041 [Trematosphaeria pertusa]